MELGLSGKTVLVTGATGDLGGTIARAFHAAGARVALGYGRGAEAAEELARELGEDRGLALAVPTPLGDPETLGNSVDLVTGRWGGIDVLVTAAADRVPPRRPGAHFEDVAAADWTRFLQDNLFGTVHAVQRVLPGMRERGWGRIVLLSSQAVHEGKQGAEIYTASKAALHGLARALTWDTAPDGVLLNLVAPGMTLTGKVLGKLPEHIRKGEESRAPSGRLSTPQQVADTVLFLASEANGNISGESVTIAGGR
ncbi:SDR family oxidoreductase (plasmid) [Streptomyces sp. NBC_00435]|uniref:SDR family NAD(P)-dependent oxidoreductase n=1 Tax=Streptomyces sp. NBC_00435 TaxID=2903649 RepID=UPI002E1FE05F